MRGSSHCCTLIPSMKMGCRLGCFANRYITTVCLYFHCKISSKLPNREIADQQLGNFMQVFMKPGQHLSFLTNIQLVGWQLGRSQNCAETSASPYKRLLYLLHHLTNDRFIYDNAPWELGNKEDTVCELSSHVPVDIHRWYIHDL